MKIPIVNEQDEVIGSEERSVIHQKGLKHREIHIWLVTENKEFIFQKRSLNKDTWPGKLDVTVGGHIDGENDSYEETAQRELFEETGINVPLRLIFKKYSESFDPNTNTFNNTFRSTFAGLYGGNINDLKIEEGEGLGFVKFSIEDILNLNEEQKNGMIPSLYSEKCIEIYKKIINELFNNENKN